MSSPLPRVAIDGRTLQARPPGGIGRMLATLLPELAQRAELDLLFDTRRVEPQIGAAAVKSHYLGAPLSGLDSVWLQLAAPRWLRGYPGAFHCPFYGLPYAQPAPMIVTIHDLTFEFAPELFRPSRRFVFRRQARWAAKTARRILTVSEHVRTTILERYAAYGVTGERVVVAPPPLDPVFRPDPDGLGELLERLAISQPYVVTLGGAPRRQLPVAVAAWKLALGALGIEPRELPLVVLSGEAPDPADGVIYAGSLNDQDMAGVFAGARAFCNATSYEGFGMPALEAAAAGVPVVCACVGSLPEVLGDAAAWCERPEAEPLGEALAGVLGDANRARDLADAGLERARLSPSAADVAEVMTRAYREAQVA